MDEYRGVLKKIFTWSAVVFEGKNKKIAYAAGLDGHKIIPIQLITMLASSFAGVVTLVLFTEGKPLLAYLAATALCRFLEDFFRILPQRLPRQGEISAYQLMSVFSVIFALAVSLYLQR